MNGYLIEFEDFTLWMQWRETLSSWWRRSGPHKADQGGFLPLCCGEYPLHIHPSWEENREEQGGALNSKIAVIAMLQFEALEDGESRVKSNNTGSFLGNAGITWVSHPVFTQTCGVRASSGTCQILRYYETSALFFSRLNFSVKLLGGYYYLYVLNKRGAGLDELKCVQTLNSHR